jgi:PBP1b-binding outer membrane lipoprotein LpoB
MKLKFLAILSLSAFLFLSGCSKNEANTNANNANRPTATATPTPIVKTNETAATNPALQKTIEDALKAKGFNTVTVDVSTTPATLRGTYPKGKLPEVLQTAQLANGEKPVKNEMTEAK